MFDNWDYKFPYGQTYYGIVFYSNPRKRFALIGAFRGRRYRILWKTYATYRAALQAISSMNYQMMRFEIIDLENGDRSIY